MAFIHGCGSLYCTAQEQWKFHYNYASTSYKKSHESVVAEPRKHNFCRQNQVHKIINNRRHCTDQSASVLELHSISQAPGRSTRPGHWGSDGTHTGQSSAGNASSAALCYSAENSVHTSSFTTLIPRHSRYQNNNLCVTLALRYHFQDMDG